MGLPEEYALPERYNDAYHLTGDGVAVPVVRYLAAQLLEPLLKFRDYSPKRANKRRDGTDRSESTWSSVEERLVG